ncbi:hypothetical protein [Bradyrhizobium sp. BR 10289]|uniref:hypothetical protein n=1 Tax=Bradyrhizobium sp. BR 10289 TaxID=2749993 RepID=UPI001C64F7C0|nr:hypothetical protein [Bradyrhizobium sp. BR 10289]MBW7968113.1 hypothetical protein [Bradyrhizobium sp. BR 10289]
MAITFPRSDILTLVGFEAPFTFEPVSQQEQSRLASGITIGKDLGPALWFATYTTEELHNDVMVDYQAVLASLDGIINPFEGWDLRRPAPRLYPDGTGAANGVLAAVNANNKAVSLSGLNAGQVISRGDYLSFDYTGGRALHQAMETVTASGGGVSPQFEVRPHLRAGWTLSTAVNLKAPRGIFTLMPGSVVPTQTRGKYGRLTFKTGQALL